VIRFDHVRKSYPGGHVALTDVNFAIESHEMVFLTGHSGAGKSTVLQLISCLQRPNTGQVLVAGRNIGTLPDRRIPTHRRRVGLIFQDHRLLMDRTVFDNVALPLVIQGYQRRDLNKRVRASLDQVGLLGKERLQPIALSGGEQQRVGIARAIVANPPLLLADEPTGNLDPRLSWEILNLFARINAQGTCVFIASHDLDLVRRMRRRVLVLRQGQLVDDIAANDMDFTHG